MLSGTSLICANVGDSRAVIGSLRTTDDAQQVELSQQSDFKIETIAGPAAREGFSWMATQVSIDHKPDRKDEYQRIIMSGGRVDPF